MTFVFVTRTCHAHRKHDGLEGEHPTVDAAAEPLRPERGEVAAGLAVQGPRHAQVLGMAIPVAVVVGNQASGTAGFPQSDPVSWLHVNPVRFGHVPRLLTLTRGHDQVLAHEVETVTACQTLSMCIAGNKIRSLFVGVLRLQ